MGRLLPPPLRAQSKLPAPRMFCVSRARRAEQAKGCASGSYLSCIIHHNNNYYKPVLSLVVTAAVVGLLVPGSGVDFVVPEMCTISKTK